MTQLSKSKTRRVAAIGDGCVIPGERKRGSGSNWGGENRRLGPGLRRGDDVVIPGERDEFVISGPTLADKLNAHS